MFRKKSRSKAFLTLPTLQFLPQRNSSHTAISPILRLPPHCNSLPMATASTPQLPQTTTPPTPQLFPHRNSPMLIPYTATLPHCKSSHIANPHHCNRLHFDHPSLPLPYTTTAKHRKPATPQLTPLKNFSHTMTSPTP